MCERTQRILLKHQFFFSKYLLTKAKASLLKFNCDFSISAKIVFYKAENSTVNFGNSVNTNVNTNININTIYMVVENFQGIADLIDKIDSVIVKHKNLRFITHIVNNLLISEGLNVRCVSIFTIPLFFHHRYVVMGSRYSTICICPSYQAYVFHTTFSVICIFIIFMQRKMGKTCVSSF